MTKSEIVRAEAERRGLRVEPHGKAWRIHGPGVDILTCALHEVNVSELTAMARTAPAFKTAQPPAP